MNIMIKHLRINDAQLQNADNTCNNYKLIKKLNSYKKVRN